MSNGQALQSLRQAAQLLALNELNAAEQLLDRHLRSHGPDPDALHIFASLRQRQGRHADAEDLFQKCLRLQKGRVEAHFALGTVLKAQSKLAAAINAYRKAIALRPYYLEALFNLAVTLQEIGDFPASERVYRQVLHVRPGFEPALQGLGGVLLELGRSKEAIPLFRKLLQAWRGTPREAIIEHALSLACQRDGDLDAADAHNVRALAADRNLIMAKTAKADLQQQRGLTEDAIRGYQMVLSHAPLDEAAHIGLNMLLYRKGRDDAFLGSLDAAARQAPESPLPFIVKGNLLMKIDQAPAALEAFRRALTLAPLNTRALLGTATAYASLMDFAHAISAYERAIAIQPDDANVLTGFAAALLQAQEPKRAHDATSRALGLRPYDQCALAILGLVYRALGDEREEDLCGYQRFVRPFELEVEGFSDMADFNRELAGYLDGFQTDQREHLDQTVRGGTRAATRLFDGGHELVERLRAAVDRCVARYISELPTAPAHPFAGRRSRSFAYSGSWSSRLAAGGFHTNHIHPSGWISSAYYVAVPEESGDAAIKAGWLKFGEPPWKSTWELRRTIQPIPGRLVLFPSYLWHGTLPFASNHPRTTVAFDVVPT